MSRRLFICLAALIMILTLALPGLAAPKDFIRAGNQAARDGQMLEAVTHYTTAIDSGQLSAGNLAVALANRGAAQDDLGKTALAIKDFNRAIKADPTYDPAYYNRSFALEKQKNLRAAYQDMRKALSLMPNDPDYQQRLNYLMHELGKQK